MRLTVFQGRFRWLITILLIYPLFSFLYATSPVRAEENPTEGWQTKGLPGVGTDFCFDTSRPSTLYLNKNDSETYAYNWSSGQQTLLNNHPYDFCGPNGLLYASQNANESKKTGPFTDGRSKDAPGIRFSLDDPAGKTIAHTPTHAAQDGTDQVYTLGTDSAGFGRLWYSSDGGLNWQERGQQFNGLIKNLLVSSADGRSTYIMVVDSFNLDSEYSQKYTIYFSGDAGATWDKRSDGKFSYYNDTFPFSTLLNMPGRTASVDTVMFFAVTGPSRPSTEYKVSFDGGRTFKPVATGYTDQYSRLTNTNKGLVVAEVNNVTSEWTMKISTDQAATWQDLKIPGGKVKDVWSAPAAPDNLFWLYSMAA